MTQTQTTGRTMKVAVTMTVEIDVEAYTDTYGPTSAADVREHVRSAILSAANQPGIIASEGVVIEARER